MSDIKNTQEFKGLNSAVLDVLNQNQNLYQQDLERQYAGYAPKQPEQQDPVVDDGQE